MIPKIIAMYLPQYHQIPENDEFWGKGFSDWVTVRNAKPIYKGHKQPRTPLHGNYYDLSIEDNVVWQSDLAHKYGIFGFGVYHYWFNNDKNLLTIPANILRDNERIKVNYFLAWDNASWKRSWSNLKGNDWAPMAEKQYSSQQGPQILIPYILGGKSDWRKHYCELLTHFKSPRYIKKDNKPLFSILNYGDNILEMCDCWNKWAQEDGFDGVFFIFKNSPDIPSNLYKYNYEPHTSGWGTKNMTERIIDVIVRIIKYRKRMFYDYDMTWNRLLKHASSNADSKLYYGAFSSYDDSPRRGKNKSIILRGATPMKFKKYLSKLISISEKQEKEFVFLTAWNEWGEGAFLEPDELYGYSYLEAIRECLK